MSINDDGDKEALLKQNEKLHNELKKLAEAYQDILQKMAEQKLAKKQQYSSQIPPKDSRTSSPIFSSQPPHPPIRWSKCEPI